MPRPTSENNTQIQAAHISNKSASVVEGKRSTGRWRTAPWLQRMRTVRSYYGKGTDLSIMIDALVAAVSDVVCASAYPLKPQKADRLLTAKVIQCAYVWDADRGNSDGEKHTQRNTRIQRCWRTDREVAREKEKESDTHLMPFHPLLLSHFTSFICFNNIIFYIFYI